MGSEAGAATLCYSGQKYGEELGHLEAAWSRAAEVFWVGPTDPWIDAELAVGSSINDIVNYSAYFFMIKQ